MKCLRAMLVRLAVAGGVFMSLCAQLCTQTGSSNNPSIVLLLRDPSGATVKHAKGWLRSQPTWQLDAIASTRLSLLGLASPRATEHVATCDTRGLLRFSSDTGNHIAAGSGIARTEAGLGALIPRVYAGRANRITLRPLAEVTTATGSETITLLARARLADGSTIVLPIQKGQKLRLPQGSYEIWAGTIDGVIWQQLQIKSGERKTLNFSLPAQRLRYGTQTTVHPSGHARALLRQFIAPPIDEGDYEIALLGDARHAPLISYRDGIVSSPRAATPPISLTAKIWPPPADHTLEAVSFQLAEEAPLDTRLIGLSRKDDGSFRIVAYAKNVNGKLTMPTCPDGDSWLLLLANGRAPLAQPWATADKNAHLMPPEGRTFSIVARDQNDIPIQDLACSYTPHNQDAAQLNSHTDAFGTARFGAVTAPGLLRISDPRYANQEVDLDLLPADSLKLKIDTGTSSKGSASFSDKFIDQSIIVTLRDPLAELRPAQRTLVTAPGKSFAFSGLEMDHNYVIFATAQRDGKTWSARQIIHATDDFHLVLKNEDPKIGR
jgi:hypothetical protein